MATQIPLASVFQHSLLTIGPFHLHGNAIWILVAVVVVLAFWQHLANKSRPASRRRSKVRRRSARR